MSSIKKILVPFDDNLLSIRALEYAAMFASGIGATITVFHLADPATYNSKKEFMKELMTIIEEQLRPKFREIQVVYPQIQKINIQTKGLEVSIDTHIIEFASENNFDFIIMKSHGQDHPKNWDEHFKSTTAYKVVLAAPCPVFTFTRVPENPQVKHILVPLDLSEGSLYKLPFVISLATQFNATLHLLSASEHKEDHEELQQQITEISDELRGKQITVVQKELFSGTLPEAINAYTKEKNMDLIAIMSRPGFRWSDLWLSPKAKRIIAQSSVPVVSFRSDKPLDIGI